LSPPLPPDCGGAIGPGLTRPRVSQGAIRNPCVQSLGDGLGAGTTKGRSGNPSFAKGISRGTPVASRVALMELLKGVHVIETYATTTLLVDDRLILVDTSADADAGKVMDYLNHIRVKPKDLSTIFITHTHPHHAGRL